MLVATNESVIGLIQGVKFINPNCQVFCRVVLLSAAVVMFVVMLSSRMKSRQYFVNSCRFAYGHSIIFDQSNVNSVQYNYN